MSNTPEGGAVAERDVLPGLIRKQLVEANFDGPVDVGRQDPPNVFLYGPYWRLSSGVYRLRFTCTIRDVASQSPFLAVEVFAQNRHFVTVRDFCPSELVDGSGSLTFAVTAQFAQDAGANALFEFRFLHYGIANFSITSVTLIPQDYPQTPAPLHWRLSARLRGESQDHAQLSPACLQFALTSGHVHCRAAPGLHLPSGTFRLSFRSRPGSLAFGQRLKVAIRAGGSTLADRLFDLAGRAPAERELQFEVPPEHAVDQGAVDSLSIEFHKHGLGSLAITDIELSEVSRHHGALSEAPGGVTPGIGAPAVDGRAPVRVVIIGNCQAELLANGFRVLGGPDRIRIRYHSLNLQETPLDTARRDLRAADMLLVQGIGDFENYRLREEIPDKPTRHSFPMLWLATLWPYDSIAGFTDRVAEQREALEPIFVHLDGALARLRREVPDPEARVRAYRELAMPWAINLDRLAGVEERRLTAMDRLHHCGIGAYILEDFRTTRLFHSFGRPSDVLFVELLRHILRVAGLERSSPTAGAMDQLCNLQIPVHPVVARTSGLAWADERSRYGFRGVPVTWEQYVRRYIAHFG